MSMRSLGYSFNNAIADILDNSISAKATKIEILCNWDKEEPFIEIKDNGVGMTNEELEEAMRLGSKSPLYEREKEDLGRFGLGLKTASFSQAKKLIVKTKKDESTFEASWDLDLVEKENKWFMDIDKVDGENEIKDKGTIVRWEKIDTLEKKDQKNSQEYFESITAQLAKHISLVFHRYITGDYGTKISFSINGNICPSADPFFKEKSTNQPPEVIANQCKVISYSLPHHTNCSSEDWDFHAGEEGYLANQGFYLYRNGRLICKATWFGLARKLEMRKLCRISIDIDNSSDSEWQLDVKKSRATPPQMIRGRLRDLIDAFSRPAIKKFTKRAKALMNKEKSPIWERFVSSDRQIIYKISKEHPSIKFLLNSLSEELADEVEKTLSLIEKLIPLQLISSDYAEDPKNLITEELTIKEIVDQAKNIIDFYLKQGLSEEESYTVLQEISFFRDNWESIKDNL